MEQKYVMTFEQFQNYLNEKSKPGKIEAKDWIRMFDLVVAGKDGKSVAAKIKDKNKAIARFVSGLKLINDEIYFNDKLNKYQHVFSEFGNKALELGATKEEIKTVFDNAVIPLDIIEKLKGSKNKKLDNRFVGNISKKLMKAGYDIEFLKHNGYAITSDGKEAMRINGRKWTIGYKTIISKGSQQWNFYFDAITDEGDGPTKYVIDEYDSDKIFNSMKWDIMGKQKFEKALMKTLNDAAASNENVNEKFDTDILDDNDVSLGSIIKNVKELKKGKDYCIADLGMNAWMAALKYKGKKGDTHSFKSSLQFDDLEMDFSTEELEDAISAGEIANCK